MLKLQHILASALLFACVHSHAETPTTAPTNTTATIDATAGTPTSTHVDKMAEPAKDNIPTTPKAIDIVQLPNFKQLSVTTLATKIESELAKCNANLEQALQKSVSFENTLQPFLIDLESLKASWNLLIIQNNVAQTEQTVNTLTKVMPEMMKFQSNLMHNVKLYQALNSLQTSAEFAKLLKPQQIFIKQLLLDYKLHGINLDANNQLRHAQIIVRLREIAHEYNYNLQQATNTFEYYVEEKDAKLLAGIPDFILKEAANLAKAKQKTGWLFTLNNDFLIAIESYAKDSNLRETFYDAFVTIASKQDEDPTRRKWDNTALVAETIELRQELATLLGYKNFAEYALADRTPPDPAQALQFLVNTATKIKPKAQQEYKELENYAKQKVRPWDIAYFAQARKNAIVGQSQAQSSDYFNKDATLQALFNLTSILFNINVVPVKDASTWDKDVTLYNIVDVQNKSLGYFYLDLFARNNKEPIDKILMYVNHVNNSPIVPVAVLTTNLPKNNNLTHDSVTRIFAQYGEMLVHLIANKDYPSFSNGSGMMWDAIAQSNQFMQNWAWQKQYIQDSAKNADGKKIPDELFNTLLAAHQFDSAINLLSQIQLAMFDLRIHLNLPADKGKTALQIYNDIRNEFEVLPSISTDILPNRLTETFTSNFASTYFCYYFDKTIAMDTFNAFVEQDLFSSKIGHKYYSTMLEQAGTDSLLNLFKQFRGREPDIKFLIESD